MNDINKIIDKSVTLIDRHLDKLLEQDDLSFSLASHIQNYAKTLVIIAKDQREALKGFNPAEFTDEQLKELEKSLGETSDQDQNSTDEA